MRSPSDDSYVDEYQNVNGVAVATSKSYPSGELTQSMSEQIDRTAYFYRTITEMAADKSLTDGKVVATKGYHDASDKGGAT